MKIIKKYIRVKAQKSLRLMTELGGQMTELSRRMTESSGQSPASLKDGLAWRLEAKEV